MKLNKFLLLIFLLSVNFTTLSFSKNSYFDEGVIFFNNKEYEKARFFFEKEIVFKPKNSKSYLYLAKIFLKNENDVEQEKNLDTVLTLNPKDEDALYMMIGIKLKQSDFEEVKKLNKKFNLFCSELCNKKNEIEKKIENLLAKNEDK